MKHFEEFTKRYRIIFGVSMITISAGSLMRSMDLAPRWGTKTLAAIGLLGFLILIILYIKDVIKESKK